MIKELEFTVVDGKYVSNEFSMNFSGKCCIGLEFTSEAEVYLLRSIDNYLYDKVENSEQQAETGYNEFSVINAVNGQYIKVVCNVKPQNCKIKV